MNFLRNLYKLTSFQTKLPSPKSFAFAFRHCSSKPPLDISDPAVLRYLEYIKKEYWNLHTKSSVNTSEKNRLKQLLPIVKVLEERLCIVENLNNLEELNEKDSKDKDLLQLVKEERDTYNEILKKLDQKLVNSLLDDNVNYGSTDAILEIVSGVGGQEAMLFAREVYNMYMGYAKYKGWMWEVTQLDSTELGGVRKAEAVVSGVGAFQWLRLEGGVHRVQRVPATEKGGRLHTSTISIAVMLQPSEIEIVIPSGDIRVETKRATGAGGQHVNTTDSAVRIVHLPTGMATECQTERDQHKNRRVAMAKLRALLYQQQSEKQVQEERALRKSQIGLGLRNEKIRTYNYNQDRVTDHRIGGAGGTVHDLANLMQGGAVLDQLIIRLRKFTHTQEILNDIEFFGNADKENKTLLKNNC